MRRRSFLLVAIAHTLAIAGGALPASAQRSPSSPDWNALTREATHLLSEYIRINTSNPPGNELDGALFLKSVFEREGIEVQLLDTGVFAQRRGANLYARVRGNGSKPAIALVHHIDVVPAAAELWSVPPFSGEVRDGYVRGRGALDMKSEGIAHLVALLAIKRSGLPLTRDIVYIANTDEELGSTGVLTFVARHAELVRDVEFMLTEGGNNSVVDGRLQYIGVGVAEKRTFWQRLTVRGVASHGSRPTPHNPVPRLATALHRLGSYETPIEITPAADRYFRDIARTYPSPQREWLADVGAAMDDEEGRRWILSDVNWNAILRMTITPTVLRGSDKTNTIPAVASAEVDVRLLPHHDRDSALVLLRSIVADTAVHFETLLEPKAPLQSPVQGEIFTAVEAAARSLGLRDAFVTTVMQPYATDRPVYQQLGIKTYGIDPFLVPQDERQRGMHGTDERISVENLGFGVRFVYEIVRQLQ
jgi:acetylornithine deacetylase/succinyl-diaminopimelate desuccinylase-like protein